MKSLSVLRTRQISRYLEAFACVCLGYLRNGYLANLGDKAHSLQSPAEVCPSWSGTANRPTCLDTLEYSSVDFFSPHNRYRLAFGPGLYFLLGINHTDVSDTQKCETVSRFYMKTFPGIRQGYSPGDYDHIAKPLIKKQSKDIRPSRWAKGDNGREVYRYTYSPDNIKYLTSEYNRYP